jgi:uncharacterized phage protein (TIGR01671 family)
MNMNNTMTTAMQREIKFRAWIIDEARMSYGDEWFSMSPDGSLIQYADQGFWVNNLNTSKEHKEYLAENDIQIRDEFILQQYTGLKENNGKEIYEGDIVRWDDMTNGEKWRVAVVEIKPDLQFKIIRINCDFIQSAQEGYVFRFGNFIYKDTHNHLEVVGNIYQHPELLQTENLHKYKGGEA